MNRRTDHVTAEKVSIALLTRAAFGEEAGVRMALRAGVPDALICHVFCRTIAGIRVCIAGINPAPERRRQLRLAPKKE